MAVYGLRPYKQEGEPTIKKYRMKASTTITKYDPVSLEFDTTGDHDEVDLTAAGEVIYGIAMETKTSTANGGEEISVMEGRGLKFKVDNDNDSKTFGTDYGAGYLFNITGTTGAVLVDTSTGTTTEATGGQLRCVDSEVDASDASIGVFVIVENQYGGTNGI